LNVSPHQVFKAGQMFACKARRHQVITCVISGLTPSYDPSLKILPMTTLKLLHPTICDKEKSFITLTPDQPVNIWKVKQYREISMVSNAFHDSCFVT
jgi:hypothetical protein